MDYHIKLLETLYNDGFEKLIDKMEELINNGDSLINLIILNMNNENNVILISNFVKIGIERYGNVVRKILDSNLEEKYKKKFLMNILNCENMVLFDLLKESDYELMMVDEDLEESVLFKILNNKQIFKNVNLNNRLLYYKELCENIYENDNFGMIRWMYKCVELYDNRYKSYDKKKICEDSIIYILIYSMIDKIENYKLDNYLECSDEINELKFENIKYDDLLNVLILKMINISVYYSIDKINKNNENINKCRSVMTELNKNHTILNQFDILKKYMKKRNEVLIKDYEDDNVELMNKMNIMIMTCIYDYYVNMMKYLMKNNINENSIFFSNLLLNVIDYYVFYSKNYKYVYKDNEERNEIFIYMCDVFCSDCSNININIKMIDFFMEVLVNEMLYIINNISNKRDNDLIESYIKKLYIFFIELDNYDDFYKYNAKYKIISLFNNLFNKPNILRDVMSLLIENNRNIILKFVLNMYEMINVCMEKYISYNNSELYIILKNQKSYYLIELLEYNIFMLNNYKDLIGDDIIENYVSKMNKVLKDMDINILSDKKTQELIYLVIKTYNLINSDLIVNNLFYDKETVIKIANKLRLYTKRINIIENYERLLKIEKREIKNENMNEIPDDYLDPITNEIINDVVILPSSKKKMDLSVIKKHLLYHDFAPFNRDKLCLEELEKYNKDEKIREECNQFMMSLNDWKSKSL